jgi:hypothetical protein
VWRRGVLRHQKTSGGDSMCGGVRAFPKSTEKHRMKKTRTIGKKTGFQGSYAAVCPASAHTQNIAPFDVCSCPPSLPSSSVYKIPLETSLFSSLYQTTLSLKNTETTGTPFYAWVCSTIRATLYQIHSNSRDVEKTKRLAKV